MDNDYNYLSQIERLINTAFNSRINRKTTELLQKTNHKIKKAKIAINKEIQKRTTERIGVRGSDFNIERREPQIIGYFQESTEIICPHCNTDQEEDFMYNGINFFCKKCKNTFYLKTKEKQIISTDDTNCRTL